MMKKGNLEFDPRSYSFKKAGRDISHLVWRVVRYVLFTLSLTIAAYAVLALFISTDTERKLQKENKMYEDVLPMLEAKRELVRDAVANLQHKDNVIYNDVFHSAAPSPDPMGSLDFLFGSDTIPDTKILKYTDAKAAKLVEDAASIDAKFEEVLLALARKEKPVPPMLMPLSDISYVQIGASRGMKFSPFLKTSVQHSGLDIIAPQGAPVYASAAGVVSYVDRSRKGQGNVVEITHQGGYLTRYAHMSDINVSKGQSVRKGQKIGAVGMTGSAYAPHLHYEVRRDSLVLDPVGYIFESVSPEEYANMLYMSVRTEQSMD